MSRKRRAAWMGVTLVAIPFPIGLCVTEEQFQSELRKLKVPPRDWPEFVPKGANAVTHVFETWKGETCVVVCAPAERESKDPNALVGLLVHEAVHVWQYIKRDIGEKNPSDEFEAYAIQMISQKLIASYSEQTAEAPVKC